MRTSNRTFPLVLVYIYILCVFFVIGLCLLLKSGVLFCKGVVFVIVNIGISRLDELFVLSFFFSLLYLSTLFLFLFFFSSFGVVRVCASVSVILYSGFPLPLPRLMPSIVVLFSACVYLLLLMLFVAQVPLCALPSLCHLFFFFYVHSFSCMQSFRFCSTLLCFNYGFPLFPFNYVYVYPLLRFLLSHSVTQNLQ